MPRATIQQKLVAALTDLGAKQDKQHTGRDMVFDFPEGHKHAGPRYYVGRNGALRKGKNKAESISLTDGKTWQSLINHGANVLEAKAQEKVSR